MSDPGSTQQLWLDRVKEEIVAARLRNPTRPLTEKPDMPSD